jgi:hypothetical protein
MQGVPAWKDEQFLALLKYSLLFLRNEQPKWKGMRFSCIGPGDAVAEQDQVIQTTNYLWGGRNELHLIL